MLNFPCPPFKRRAPFQNNESKTKYFSPGTELHLKTIHRPLFSFLFQSQVNLVHEDLWKKYFNIWLQVLQFTE